MGELMDDNIRRAALRAAAKTAILVSLAGCYEMHVLPPRSERSDDAGAVADSGRDAVDAHVAIDAGPPPRDLGTPNCAELLDRLAIHVPETPTDDGWAWGAQFSDESARNDARVGACCMELENASETDTPLVRSGEPLAMACCDVIVNTQNLVGSSSLGCTPWGPSCPPEMDEADDVAFG